MRKLHFLILFLALGIGAGAQSYTIEYEEKANIENQLKNVTDPEIRKRVSQYLSKPNTFYLYYYNGESIYIKEKVKQDSTEELSVRDDKEKRIEIGKYNGGIYKNHVTQDYLHEADVLGKSLLVVDKLEKYSWQLKDEQKKVGNYNCKKATALIKETEVTAWYTEELPLQEGPADFCGLPGLIIELVAEKKVYAAVNITENKDIVSITKPSKGKVVTKKEYQQILEDKINELKNGMGQPPRN
jgi:GLPGLI family protein